MQIVPYTSDRRAEVVELLNKALGPSTGRLRNEAYWEWKHELNPFGKSIMLLAEQDEQLIGVRAVMKWSFDTTEGNVQIGKPVDTVTHPAFQRQGVFSKLTRRACEVAESEELQWLLNTPNRNSMPGYLKLGWSPLAEVKLLAKPFRPLRSLGHLVIHKFKKSGFSNIDGVTNGLMPISDFLKEVIALGLPSQLMPSTSTSQAYLNWRYVNHPTAQYYGVLSTDKTCGFILRARTRLGLSEIQICEYFGGDRANWKNLIRQLKSAKVADYVVTSQPQHLGMLGMLKSSGFWRVPRRSVRIAGLSMANGNLFRPETVNWSLGDLEGL